MPGPPPPPAPPPPPMALGGPSTSKSAAKLGGGGGDRGALLKDIQSGRKFALKKVQTNDRSAPQVAGGVVEKNGSRPPGGANKSQQQAGMSNGPSRMPPGGGGGGGLFGPGGVPAKPSDVKRNSPARGGGVAPVIRPPVQRATAPQPAQPTSNVTNGAPPRPAFNKPASNEHGWAKSVLQAAGVDESASNTLQTPRPPAPRPPSQKSKPSIGAPQANGHVPAAPPPPSAPPSEKPTVQRPNRYRTLTPNRHEHTAPIHLNRSTEDLRTNNSPAPPPPQRGPSMRPQKPTAPPPPPPTITKPTAPPPPPPPPSSGTINTAPSRPAAPPPMTQSISMTRQAQLQRRDFVFTPLNQLPAPPLHSGRRKVYSNARSK